MNYLVVGMGKTEVKRLELHVEAITEVGWILSLHLLIKYMLLPCLINITS